MTGLGEVNSAVGGRLMAQLREMEGSREMESESHLGGGYAEGGEDVS